MSSHDPQEQLVTIVLPVHNQADHIALVVEGYLEKLRRVVPKFEMLLVSNGCRDASPEVCADLASKHPEVRHIDSRPGGWGVAVRLGLREARGEILCYTNSARTTADDLVLILLYSRTNPEAVVKANRKIRESFVRRLGSLIYNLECRALFDLPYWDLNGTPKVFPRSLSRLCQLECESDLIDAEFAVVCREEGYPMVEVPLISHGRHGGRSTTNWRTALRLYIGALRLWRARRSNG